MKTAETIVSIQHPKQRDNLVQERGLQNLAREVLSCVKCFDLVNTRTLPVCGFGSAKPSVVFVGEAPGRLGADMYGIPFTGDRSGILLQKMLSEVGLSSGSGGSVIPALKNSYITNIVRCNPRSNSGTNRAPSREEVSNCAGYLQTELELLKPKVVATLGRNATQTMVGRICTDIEYAKPISHPRFMVFPLHHPAFIVRGGGKQRLNEEEYREEFFKLKSFLDSQ